MSKQGDDHTPDTRPIPPTLPAQPPVRTAVLEYEGPRTSERPSVPLIVQFILGLVGPFAYGIPACILMIIVGETKIVPYELSSWIAIAGYVALALLIRIKLKWRAFIPGSLLVILGVPLAFVVICGMMFKGL